MTVDDKSFKVIFKNDSTASYYEPQGAYSVKYGIDSAVELSVKPNDPFYIKDKLPKSILFLKRNHKLFFLMMFPINDDAKLPAELLYSIIK